MQPTSARVLPLALFLLAVAVRLPTLGLPLDGDSAVLASVADQLGHERGTELAGQPVLLPALTAIVVACGVPATLALRWTDVLLAALLAPLTLGLARRLGAGPKTAAWAGLVMAVHPLGLLEAGGLEPGGESLLSVLLLVAVSGLVGRRAAARRAGALAALAASFAAPYGLLYGPLLFAGTLYREDGRAARLVLTLAAVAAFALLPVAGPGLAAASPGALLWLPAAGLGVLWLGAGVGVRSLWRRGTTVRLWLVGAAAHLLLLPFAFSTAGGLPLLALIAVAGARGLLEGRGARRPGLVGGATAFAAVLCLWLSLAPGRLHLLKDAMAEAAAVAGEGGWIVLAVAGGLPDEQSSLADLQPGHWTWTEAEAPAAAKGALRSLIPFPAASFETGQRIAVVAEAGKTSALHTFGGAAIFHQEVVRQLGPYVVLRAQRPRAGEEPSER